MIEKCVILCGGKSSRMGSNKALLPFKEGNLLQSLIAKYEKFFSRVYLCCKKEHKESYQCLSQNLIFEESAIFAPMIGLESALNLLQAPIFFTPVDCPFLQEWHFEKINQAYIQNQNEITYAKTKLKSHYLMGIYTPEILPKLRESIQKESFKLGSFVDLCKYQAVLFENEDDFSNLNTQEDYQNALKKEQYGRR